MGISKNRNKEILAIIPARGGSKGVPGKNIRILCGMPLIAHTILAAKESTLVSRICVSTDDRKIKSVSEEYGAEVIVRPQELASDSASSEAALLHVLGVLRERENYIPEIVVFLQCTSPLRQKTDIDNAITLLYEQKADSVFSCCRGHVNLWVQDGAVVSPVNHDPYTKTRIRQHKQVNFIENGSIYVVKTDVLLKYKNRMGGVIKPYEMEYLDSFEIDTPDQFLLVESIMKNRKERREAMNGLKDIKMLILDFDGVMTDNRVSVNEKGIESVFCNRGDGYGIEMLKKNGIEVVVISKEKNKVVQARCNKLKIKCYQGIDRKLGTLKKIMEERSLDKKEVCYVGNDINDLECIKFAGVGIAVADSSPELFPHAVLVTRNGGGKGAVRELADMIIQSRKTSYKE